MKKINVNICLAALGILIAVHAPPVALFCFLLGALTASPDEA